MRGDFSDSVPRCFWFLLLTLKALWF